MEAISKNPANRRVGFQTWGFPPSAEFLIAEKAQTIKNSDQKYSLCQRVRDSFIVRSAPEKEIESAIKLICEAPLSEKSLAKAERKLMNLYRNEYQTDAARLWLAICGRIRGVDTVEVFHSIIAKETNNRLAIVNLGAAYLVCSDAGGKVDDVFALLDELIERSPDDVFAIAIRAMMKKKFLGDCDATVDEFEGLYMNQRSYSLAVSELAAILNSTGRHEAGRDYAREAFSADPYNYQAQHLLNPRLWWTCKSSHLEYTVLNIYPIMQRAMLHAAYNLQDPKKISAKIS